MSISLYKEYSEGGYIMLPYILLKVLDAITITILSRFITELNYAQKNKLNFYDDFLCDLNK